MLRNFFPQSLHTMLLATSPGFKASGSILGSVSAEVGGAAAALISSIDLSWLSSSHCKAPCTASMLLALEKMANIQKLLTTAGLLDSYLCSFFLKAHVQKDT
jgi:hypothetical protein